MQEKLRNELKETLLKNDGKITYEMLNGGMVYLGQFIKEVIRKYSSLPVLDRICSPPEGETGYSLEPYSDFRIPPGMPIFIPLSAIQLDPQVRIFLF